MSFVDNVLKRRSQLDKLTDKAARAMASVLNKAKKEAIDRTKKALEKFEEDGQIKNTLAAKAALKATLADVQDTMTKVLDVTQETLTEAKKTAFKYQFAETFSALESAAGEELEIGGTFSQIFKEALTKMQTKPILEVPVGAEFDGVSKWTENKLRSAFSQAIASGDSIDDLADEISSITDISQRAATRIARTNMTAVMNDAHKEVYDANEDILEGYRWNATLDGRTSLICATLHGRVWKIGEEPPGPPAHPNCRSVLIPVFKDKQIQDLIDHDEQRVRNLSGKGTTLIDGDVTFEDWLTRQKKEERVDFIGSPTRETLWDGGHITFQELVKPDLTPRTDYEAIQLALAKDPNNKKLQQMAEDEGVRQKKLMNIRAEDRRSQNRQSFDKGQLP